MMQEKAKIISAGIVYVVFCTTLILIGLLIKDVNETIYPTIAGLLIFYVGFGDLVLIAKGLEEVPSEKIKRGDIDLVWGVKYYYWALWWPKFISCTK